MSNQAQYASKPHSGAGIVVTADASRTAPVTAPVTIFTATVTANSGSRIDNIDIIPVGTTTATMIRLFTYDGATYNLLIEIPVSANTPSATNAANRSGSLSSAVNNDILPLILPTGWSLRATINDTQAGGGVKITARGGDFA